ncbi:hypothetical protein D1AOALGA4SA_4564 [Olavius algarvensis Delta 1 endosymbiont]|nr:hypothetical protein D1AOALGA4SA_4564 [Olavius algarvensis Delta 1 endosymbiont]
MKETFKKRISNIEQGIMNVEVRYSIHLKLFKIVRAKRFHTSSFDISCSIFCGSFLNFHIVSQERLPLAKKTASLIKKD